MTYLLAAILLVLTTLPVLDAARRKEIFARPEFYLLGAIYLYGTFGYVTQLFFSSQDFYFILPATKLYAHESYLYSAGAVLAVYLGGGLYRSGDAMRAGVHITRDRTLALLAAGGCTLALAFNLYYFASYGLFSGEFDRVVFIDEFKPRLGFSFPYMTVLLASLPTLALHERWPASWGFFLAFALLHLPVGDRRVVLAAFIVLVVAKILGGLSLGRRALAIILAVSLVVGILVGTVRGRSLASVSELDFEGVFRALSEFSRPFVTLVYYVENGYTTLYGAGFLQSVVNVIPGFVLPFKKFPSPGQQFVDVVEGMAVIPGRVPGFGFYPVTEALINFGPLGVPIFFLLFAFLVRKLSYFAVTRGLVFVVPVLCAAMFSFGRSSFTNVLTTNLWVITFGVILHLAAGPVARIVRGSSGKNKEVES